MTKLLVTILLLIGTKVGNQPIKTTPIAKVKKADFWKAYFKLRKWEGNYGWYSNDPGGETYAGIARGYNKDWIGWYILDEYKQDSVVYHNKYIQRLETFVLDYYVTRWVKYEYYNLKDQQIANYVFDYHNQGAVAAIHISQILNQQDSTFQVTNQFSTNLINKLNTVDSTFVEKLRQKRVWYYTRTVQKHPRQKMFYQGWLNRSNDII